MYLAAVIHGIKNYNIKPHVTLFNRDNQNINPNQCTQICTDAFNESTDLDRFLRDYSKNTSPESGWKMKKYGTFCALEPATKSIHAPDIHISVLKESANNQCNKRKISEFINKEDVMHVMPSKGSTEEKDGNKIVISTGKFQDDGTQREGYEDFFSIDSCVKHCISQVGNVDL